MTKPSLTNTSDIPSFIYYLEVSRHNSFLGYRPASFPACLHPRSSAHRLYFLIACTDSMPVCSARIKFLRKGRRKSKDLVGIWEYPALVSMVLLRARRIAFYTILLLPAASPACLNHPEFFVQNVFLGDVFLPECSLTPSPEEIL